MRLEEWAGKEKGMTSTTQHADSDSVAKAAGGDGNVEGRDKQQLEETMYEGSSWNLETDRPTVRAKGMIGEKG